MSSNISSSAACLSMLLPGKSSTKGPPPGCPAAAALNTTSNSPSSTVTRTLPGSRFDQSYAYHQLTGAMAEGTRFLVAGVKVVVRSPHIRTMRVEQMIKFVITGFRLTLLVVPLACSRANRDNLPGSIRKRSRERRGQERRRFVERRRDGRQSWRRLALCARWPSQYQSRWGSGRGAKAGCLHIGAGDERGRASTPPSKTRGILRSAKPA